MATTRVRKVGGIYNDAGFGKLVKQLNGRALLGVTLINSNCEECIKLHSFIKHLEHGFIDKIVHIFSRLIFDVFDIKTTVKAMMQTL